MNSNNDRITTIMNNPELIRKIIQVGINKALLLHKQAGNPVCELKDGEVVWLQPEDIPTRDNKELLLEIDQITNKLDISEKMK